jgi:hypothetical protein
MLCVYFRAQKKKIKDFLVLHSYDAVAEQSRSHIIICENPY